ncbi:MAG: hypothetical protein LUM44_08945 [Pyrinomonadaceae bacterium]|nr:hypothetical protein [Pyrinomonadaceae bacterium]
MSSKYRKLFSLFTAFIIIVLGKYVIVAQTEIRGDWKASVNSEKSEKKLNLSMSRNSGKNNRNQMGSSFDVKDFEGLSESQFANSNVRFSLTREAGRVDFEGNFSNNKGSGTFVFRPDQQFFSAMKSRGFDFEKPSKNSRENEVENRMFAAMALDVKLATADDLLSANFGDLDVDDLFKATIFKIDSSFMREMKASGFPNLGMEELVKARIFKIDAEFLRSLNENGLATEDFENVVKMRIFKITPEFINGVRAEGFSKLDIEDLVKMKIFNIDAEFIRKARAEGVPMDVEKLVQKRIGVWGK